MNRDLLIQIGEALYGANWKADLAHDLNVSNRTLRGWIKTGSIPEGVQSDLVVLCQNAKAQLDDILSELSLEIADANNLESNNMNKIFGSNKIQKNPESFKDAPLELILARVVSQVMLCSVFQELPENLSVTFKDCDCGSAISLLSQFPNPSIKSKSYLEWQLLVLLAGRKGEEILLADKYEAPEADKILLDSLMKEFLSNKFEGEYFTNPSNDYEFTHNISEITNLEARLNTTLDQFFYINRGKLSSFASKENYARKTLLKLDIEEECADVLLEQDFVYPIIPELGLEGYNKPIGHSDFFRLLENIYTLYVVSFVPDDGNMEYHKIVVGRTVEEVKCLLPGILNIHPEKSIQVKMIHPSILLEIDLYDDLTQIIDEADKNKCGNSLLFACLLAENDPMDNLKFFGAKDDVQAHQKAEQLGYSEETGDLLFFVGKDTEFRDLLSTFPLLKKQLADRWALSE